MENRTHVKKEREALPDILRGFAILLVVWGHCIQEGNGAQFSASMSYFDDKLYQFIYSFHMPLFAMIAGFYAYNSLAHAVTWHDRFKILGRRISTYLIPIVFWTAAEYIRELIINYRSHAVVPQGIVTVITDFLGRVVINHWFLWAMIVCFVIVWVMHCFLKDNVIIYICIFLAMFFIPDGMNLHTYKYLLPYYLLAFYYCMNITGEKKASYGRSGIYRAARDLYTARRGLLTAVSGIIFCILFLFYRRRAFIYVSGYRITKDVWYIQLVTDIYRFAIGLAGCVFFVCLWAVIKEHLRYDFRLLRLYGRYSLGVYLLSGYITLLGMRRITDNLMPDDMRATLEAVFVAAISLAFAYMIGKVPILKAAIGQRGHRQRL